MPEESAKGKKQSSFIDMIQKIVDYIEENLYEELSPNIIAAQFYLSIPAINHLFKTVCDMTIMEYVRNRRLSLAGQELMRSNIHIIDLAFKYGYETPEAFAKAFTRFHGFPPSFVRRTYPEIKIYNPIKIKLEIQGGWDNQVMNKNLSLETKGNYSGQEKKLFHCYDKTTKMNGGLSMDKKKFEYRIRVSEMKQKEEWRILLMLAKKFEEAGIKFKVDGKTMIFAHGLEFKLEKICFTFKWNEEQKILDFFGVSGKAKSSYSGFKYFDTVFESMKIRCMFYGECSGDDTDEFLFHNAEPVEVDGQIIFVQTLEFYLENAEPDKKYYKMVEDWLKL